MKASIRAAINGSAQFHRVTVPIAEAGDNPRPKELSAVLVDAVRLVLAEKPASPDEVERNLTDCGLRPKSEMVKRACMYLYYGGELRLEEGGRYVMLAPVREPALRRRAIS